LYTKLFNTKTSFCVSKLKTEEPRDPLQENDDDDIITLTSQESEGINQTRPTSRTAVGVM